MSQYYALQGGTYIPENANLDNYKTPGNYYCDSSALVPTIVNCPSNNAFTMKVEYSTGNGYPAQVIRQHDTGDIFYRFFTSYQNRWYPWISYVTNTDFFFALVSGQVSNGGIRYNNEKITLSTVCVASLAYNGGSANYNYSLVVQPGNGFAFIYIKNPDNTAVADGTTVNLHLMFGRP